MDIRFKSKGSILDVGVTAVAATVSVGIMITLITEAPLYVKRGC